MAKNKNKQKNESKNEMQSKQNKNDGEVSVKNAGTNAENGKNCK